MKRFSLTRRLIAIVIVCQLCLTAAIAFTAVYYSRKELRSAFDAALDSRAINVLAGARYTESQPRDLLFDPLVLPRYNTRVPDLFQIRKTDGSILAASAIPWPAPADQPDGRYTEFELSGIPYRAVVLRDVPVLDEEDTVNESAHVTVFYASSLVQIRRRLAELVGWVLGASLAFLVLSSVIAAWGIRKGLSPLHELASRASAISVRNWDFQPPAGASSSEELAPLTEALETTLAGLKDAFRQQRDFTSDAAHELKTSVAILKSTLQSLLHRDRREHEYRAGIDRSMEDCNRLEDLVERLLRLARIEQNSEQAICHLGITELSSTCESAISRIGALASEHSVAVKLVNPITVHLRADPEDLEIIWVNLLENAVRYSPEGTAVAVSMALNGPKGIDVSVEDSGPGIPPDELPHIFERFHRADHSRARSTGGFGLGLAICKAIVLSYGGEIEAFNRPDRGTQVRVFLPIESFVSTAQNSASEAAS